MDYESDNGELNCHNVTASRTIMTITFFLGWLGLALNLLSLCVWSHYEKKIAMHIYLQALAVADSTAIAIDALVDGIDCMMTRKVFEFNNKLCIFEVSLDALTTYGTFWVIAIIVMDRCISFLYPHSYKTRFKKPKVAWIVLSITMFLLYVPSLILSGFIELEVSETQLSKLSTANCAVKQGIYYSILLYASSILGSGASMTIVVVCTAIIIYEINIQQRGYTHRLSKTQSIATAQDNISVRPTGESALQDNQTIQRSVMTAADQSRTVKGSSEQLTELRNLSVCISVIFVILCGTSQALYIYSHKSKTIGVKHVIADALDEFFNVCNSSINFFLYCFSSPKFRKELKCMLSRWKLNITGPFCKKQPSDITNADTHISLA